MTNREFTPDEQALIDRLHRAPQPQLNTAKFQSIQKLILQELDTPARPVRRPNPPVVKIMVVGIVVAVILAMLAVVNSQQASNPVTTAAPTAEPTVEVNSSDSVIVIEGPVQAINGSTIRIFDTDILINADNPALALIEVGKTVRVEGYSEVRDTIIVFIAINVSVEKPPDSLPPDCKITKKGHMRCTRKK